MIQWSKVSRRSSSTDNRELPAASEGGETPSRVTYHFHPYATGTQDRTPKTLSSDIEFACLIASLSSSQQASNYKKDICATVWIAKTGKSLELQGVWKQGSMEMSEPVSASGDEGRCTAGRALLSCRERGPERWLLWRSGVNCCDHPSSFLTVSCQPGRSCYWTQQAGLHCASMLVCSHV